MENAYTSLKKVEKKLERFKPKSPMLPYVEKRSVSEASLFSVVKGAVTFGVSLIGLSLLAGIGFKSGLDLPITPDTVLWSSLGIGAVTGIVVQNLAIADGNPKHKISSWFARRFLSRKNLEALQEKHMKALERAEQLKLYDEAREAYDALVQQEIEILKQQGLFEKQAQERAHGSYYWHLDLSGKVQSIDIDEYKFRYGIDNTVETKQIESNKEVQRSIIKEIANNYQRTKALPPIEGTGHIEELEK